MNIPTDELVVIAWLKTLPGLPSGQIGTTLPEDVTKWPDGFLRVATVGGDVNDVGVRMPVVTVECWAATTGASKRTPWGRANVLAETIVEATFGEDGHGRVGRSVYPAPGDYRPAFVGSCSSVTRPQRIENDAPGFARYDVNLTVQWVLPRL